MRCISWHRRPATARQLADQDWFFLMAPEVLRVPLVILATAATVIASQAVISGAYSMSSAAMQLGLLPRLSVRRTSETEAGQIYLPTVNLLLMVGVILLVGIFKNSDASPTPMASRSPAPCP